MAVKASATVTLSCYRDTQSVTRYYKLQSSTASAPSKPTTNPPSGWSDSEPSYSSGSTNTLYFCDLTVFSDGTWSYSTISKSSSYEAAKEAWNKAQNAQNSVDNMEIGGRNYFSSKTKSEFNADNEYTLASYQNTGSFTQFYNLTKPMSYFVGKTCKLSFDIISPNGSTPLQIYNHNASPRYLMNVSGVNSPIDTTWTHQELTITVTDRGDSTDYNENSSNKIEVYCTSQMGCKIKNVKFEIGNKATDWTPAPEDVTTAIEAQTPVITGTQTSATYSWTGVAPFSELKDGQKITYWLPYSCSGSSVSMPYWKDAEGTTQQSTNSGSVLNLTLANGSTTGNIACYYGGSSRLTSHYGQGYSIELTYKKLVKIGSYYYTGWWANANYYENTRDNNITYFTGKTGAKGIWAYSLFMEDGSGTYQNICTAADGTVTSSNRTTAKTKIANTNGFKIGSSIYWTTTTYAANTNISGYAVVYSSYSGLFDSRYAFNTELVTNSLTPYKPIYLVGTIKSDGLFYLDTTWWTQTPTTEGKVYVLVGSCYDSTTSNCRITLYEDNRWYTYDGTKLQDYLVYMMVSNVDVEYYLSTSATSLSGGSWQTTAPAWVDGKYMWSRTKITDAMGNITYSPSETGTCIAGATGASGSDGKGVVSIVEQYYKSTSATSLSGGNWSTTYPGWENGKYIWTQSVITYTSGDPVTTTPVCVTGQKGDTGATGAQGIPGIDLSQGKMLYSDPMFLNGLNNCSVYNNKYNGTVTVTRTEKSSDNPFTNATHELTVTTAGEASPGLGGTVQTIQSRANAVFVRRVIAKIPSGYSLRQAENAMGSGYSCQWLTDRTGNGKFKEYIYKYTCGASGNFSTGGYMYLEGTAATSDSPVSWQIAYCTTFDMTAISDTTLDVIVGTQTSSTGSWTGKAEFSSLQDGQQIAYWLPYAGSGSATLNLTLSNGSTTGAKNCYYGGTTRLTTQYGAGNLIRLTYRKAANINGSTYEGWWADANYYYNSDTYDRTKYTAPIKCDTGDIESSQIIVGSNGVYYQLNKGRSFDVSYPILYAYSSINGGATSSNNYSAILFTVTNTQSMTLTAYKPVYIRGKLSGVTFTPFSTAPLTQAVPTSDNGYQYILLGNAASTTQIYLLPEHPIFQYYNGTFKSVEQIAVEAAKVATNYIEGTTDGLVIGNMTTSTLGKNVLIDAESVNIKDGENTILARYSANMIELGKNSEDSIIEMCNGVGRITSMGMPDDDPERPIEYTKSMLIESGVITNQSQILDLCTSTEYAGTPESHDQSCYANVSSQSIVDSSQLHYSSIYLDAYYVKDGIGNSIWMETNEELGSTLTLSTNGDDTFTDIRIFHPSQYYSSSDDGQTRFTGMEVTSFDCIKHTHGNTGKSVGLGVGGGGTNRGVYDYVNTQWMIYRDSTTNVYINGMAFGVNKVLWTGGWGMTETQTITLSSSVLSQPHGIVLVWSYYDGTNANDSNFNYFFVPKYHVSAKSGKGISMFCTRGNLGGVTAKYVYIANTSIAGYSNNWVADSTQSGSSIIQSPKDFVLRYVIGV